MPTILEETAREQARQLGLFGPQNHKDGTGLPHHQWAAVNKRVECDLATEDGTLTWRHILDEEVAEAFAERDESKLREELVQVAAVALSWCEAIDRRPERKRAA